MRRSTAKLMHETANLAYWMENPNWNSGNPAFNVVCRALQALPFSVHKFAKQAFFDTNRLIAVNGESVVAANGADKVCKFMFRYPDKMPLDTFRENVAHEVGAVTSCLAGVALPTEVSVKPADIFRRVRRPIPTVTQTQQRLDLDLHRALNLRELEDEATSPIRDRTAKDIEIMLRGIDTLAAGYDFFPDIANNSDNLRRCRLHGEVILIDVMPIHANGDRLIGDHPPGLLEHSLEHIREYQTFVGQYGG